MFDVATSFTAVKITFHQQACQAHPYAALPITPIRTIISYNVAIVPVWVRRNGPVIDQVALYGVLWKLRDLNLGLISVTPIASAKEATTNEEKKGASQTGFCPL